MQPGYVPEISSCTVYLHMCVFGGGVGGVGGGGSVGVKSARCLKQK